MTPPFIRRVTLRNYKSIAACQVDLGPLMFLVGRNGSGKSNFLDALKFVADALRDGLDHALRKRRGFIETCSRMQAPPKHLTIRLDFTLVAGQTGHYTFCIVAKDGDRFSVQNEECRVDDPNNPEQPHFYYTEFGRLIRASGIPVQAVLPDRLFLFAAAAYPQFRPVFDALSGIEVYNFNPRQIAAFQEADPADTLHKDGSNAAGILRKLSSDDKAQVEKYLSRLIPGFKRVDTIAIGSRQSINISQTIRTHASSDEAGLSSGRAPHCWSAESLSDGTIRALGILLAVFQGATTSQGYLTPALIGLEEPETALHPGATSALLSALFVGSKRRQILVSSHSPELLDIDDIHTNMLLAVDIVNGKTRIGPVDEANQEIIQRRLMTVGELLRQDQLAPAPDTIGDIEGDDQPGPFEFGDS